MPIVSGAQLSANQTKPNQDLTGESAHKPRKLESRCAASHPPRTTAILSPSLSLHGPFVACCSFFSLEMTTKGWMR